MNIDALRSRVRALQRKLALPRAQLVLQRMADELCQEWSCAQAEAQLIPHPQAFVRHVAKAGFRLPSFSAVVRYLERCRSETRLPDSLHLLRTLLPWTQSLS